MMAVLVRAAQAAFTLAVATATAGAGSPGPAIEELARFELPAEDGDGRKVDEISGLAWDADEGLLYAVSDGGKLFHVKLVFANYKPVSATIERTVSIAGGVPKLENAEGLDILDGANGIRSDTRLVIAFEDGPGLQVRAPDGTLLETLVVPEMLRNKAAYASPNDSIEAVAASPGNGIVVAPELPLREQSPAFHTVYGTAGTAMVFRRMQGALGPTGRVKALSIAPDGVMYVLERHRDDTSLEHIGVIRQIGACPAGGSGTCQVRDAADPGRSLHGLPFEGMAFITNTTMVIAADVKRSDGRSAMIFLELSGTDTPWPVAPPADQ